MPIDLFGGVESYKRVIPENVCGIALPHKKNIHTISCHELKLSSNSLIHQLKSKVPGTDSQT